MTNSEILSIAMEQSAVDCNCKKEDFTGKENMVVISQKNLGARKYLSLPFQCSLVSYGGNMVASVKEGLEQPVREFMNRYPVAHCFETPNLYALNERLEKEGLKICFMAEYFFAGCSVAPSPALSLSYQNAFAGRISGLLSPTVGECFVRRQKGVGRSGRGRL